MLKKVVVLVTIMVLSVSVASGSELEEMFGGDKAAQKAYNDIYGRPGHRKSDGNGNLRNRYTGEYDDPFTQGWNASEHSVNF